MDKFKNSNLMLLIRNSSDPEGRSSRLELIQFYIHFISLFALLGAFGRLLDAACINPAINGYIGSFIGYIIILYVVIAGFLSLIMKMRRLHDIGLSSGWFLLIFLPPINSLFLIYLLCRKGNACANSFGEMAVAPKLNLFDKFLWVLAIFYVCWMMYVHA